MQRYWAAVGMFKLLNKYYLIAKIEFFWETNRYNMQSIGGISSSSEQAYFYLVYKL